MKLTEFLAFFAHHMGAIPGIFPRHSTVRGVLAYGAQEFTRLFPTVLL